MEHAPKSGNFHQKVLTKHGALGVGLGLSSLIACITMLWLGQPKSTKIAETTALKSTAVDASPPLVPMPTTSQAIDQQKPEAPDAFFIRNKKASAKLKGDGIRVVERFTKLPTRELVDRSGGSKAVKLTYQDGSVGFIPNLPTYDAETGTFGPKPVPD